jgi:hypothetical protein
MKIYQCFGEQCSYHLQGECTAGVSKALYIYLEVVGVCDVKDVIGCTELLTATQSEANTWLKKE